jgi:phosphoserine phosphatase
MKRKEITMKSKAFVFDFDETLAHTDAVVLEDSENQFSEFNDPLTILKGTPLELMILAKEVHDEGHSVFVLTARNDCVADAIDEFLSYDGIKATAIHCVGENVNVDVAKAKRKVLMGIIENYDVVYFFDDDERNIELASDLDCRVKKV